MSGYVRIHRTLLGHPAFRNDSEAMAFAWMVAKAAWKPVRVRYKERTISLERGQLSVSQRDMAKALDRDKAWIERLWKRLKSEAMIEVASEAGVAVITICKYCAFQQSGETREAVDKAPSEAGARQGQGTEQRKEEVKKEISDTNVSSPALQPEHVVEAWNEMAGRRGLPTVRKLTPERRRKLMARIRQHPLDDWTEAIGAIDRNPWLHGDNGNGWRASFDFLLQPSSFTKLIEGTYDRSEKPANGSGRFAH